MLREDSVVLQNQKKWRCSKCLKVMPFSEFHARKQDIKGINSTCKPCTLKIERARREKRKALNQNVVPDPTLPRECSRCGEQKTQGDFPIDVSAPGGIRSICKLCHKEVQAKRRAAARGKVRSDL